MAFLNAVASLYANLIEKGRWKLEQVPAVYRAATEKELQRRAEAREARITTY